MHASRNRVVFWCEGPLACACLAALLLGAAGSSVAGSVDDPYPEIQPSNRSQAIDYLSQNRTDGPSLTPRILRARRSALAGSPGVRRSIALLSQRITFPDERIFIADDGTRIHYSVADSSLDRIDKIDENRDGVPDLLQAASTGLREARALLVGRFDLPSPGAVEIYFAELGNRFEGYLVPRRPQIDRRRIVLDSTPSGGPDTVRIAVIREYTHAVAMAGSVRFPVEWAEALATWAPTAIDGTPDGRTLALYSERIERLAVGLLSSDSSLAAGNGLWFTFVNEFYGPTTVRVIFDELAKGGAISVGLDRALRRATNDDLAAAFREFHLWAILTGDRADRHHFTFARELDAPSFRSQSSGVPTLSVQSDPSIHPFGATQVRLIPERVRGGLHVTFDGEFSARWAADLILLRKDGTKRRLAMTVSEGRGEVTLPLDGLAEAWLLIRNQGGDGDAPRRYSYAADIDTAYPYELTALSATAETNGVLISWETSSEHGLFGFNLLRSRANGGAEMTVNPIWIPALGTRDVETSYRFLDTDAENGIAYLYRLEGITTEGLTSPSPHVTVRVPTVEHRSSH